MFGTPHNPRGGLARLGGVRANLDRFPLVAVKRRGVQNDPSIDFLDDLDLHIN
jgi:hypothetical protein